LKGPFAQLLLDTARAPAVLGQRGLPLRERQLVYRHAGLQLELLLQRDGAATFVWGQISRTASGRACEAAAVACVDDRARVVGRTSTDAFGEFSLAVPPLTEGALEVEVGRGRFVCWIAARQESLP
jgi:hypothetical protein